MVQEAQLEAVAAADRLHRAPADAVSALDLADGHPAALEAARQATAARRDIGSRAAASAGRRLVAEQPRHEAHAATAPTPSQQAAARDTARRLHAVLERLPEPDRAILELRALKDCRTRKPAHGWRSSRPPRESGTAGRCSACASCCWPTA